MTIMPSFQHLLKRFKQKVKDVGYWRAFRLAVGYVYYCIADFVAYYIVGFFTPLPGFVSFLRRPRSSSTLYQRIEILRRFWTVHRGIRCAHQELELLYIADEILSIPDAIEGDIIECGVYKGGSTCKLSIVAKLVGRQVIACDSFQGLPEPRDFDAVHVCSDGRKYNFKAGDWLGTIDEVRANIDRFGEPDIISIVPGWFQDTLPSLRHHKFICMFIDVDLYDSIVCCLQNLWPGLQAGCKLFVHEADCDLTIKALTDLNLWKTNMNDVPPKFVGAETGLRPSMRQLGYIEKPTLRE